MALLAAGLALAPLALVKAADAQPTDSDVSTSNPSINSPTGKGEIPPGKDCLPVDFATADLRSDGDRVLLKVTGQAPHAGMSIEVRPVLYVMQPDYWQMALVACTAKGVKPAGAPEPFSTEINLAGSVGRKGIVKPITVIFVLIQGNRI